jgi:preprotein translocase subunit SecG
MFMTLAWAPWLIGILTVVFLLVCVMMVLTILIQRPQGGGLSGAFGSGAGSGQTAFGAKTGDALTWFTIIVFVLFVGFAVVLNYAHHPQTLPSGATVQPANGEPANTSTGEAPPSDTPAPAPTGESPAAPQSTPADTAPPSAPKSEPATPPEAPKNEPPAEPKR